MTALLVAGSGGHLAQLVRLVDRMPDIDAGDAVWVSYDGAQSRSLLAGRNVVWAEYPQPRDLRVNLRNAGLARRIVRERPFEVAVSTGASIAVSFLPVTALRGVSSHYVESATRLDGPSMSGRILRRVPGVRTWCQYRSWAQGGWHYAGNVFDGFAAEERPAVTADEVRRVVVTVGSAEGYGFRRMIERVAQVVPPDAHVLWQTGPTDVRGLEIDARATVPGDELRRAIGAADVVVSHAGIGSALVALAEGRCPVLVPRRHDLGEHVDDHQAEIARDLDARGLAVSRDADDLRVEDLLAAASRRIAEAAAPTAIRLR